MIRRKPRIALSSFALVACASALSAGEPDLVFVDGFESPEVAGPDCAFTDPGYPPAGYRATAPRTLLQLWQETSGGQIGSSPATIRLETGEYSSFAFDRSMLPSEFYSISGDATNVGFGLGPARFRWITITSCPGDLRYGPEGTDPNTDACRRTGGEGNFIYVNWGTPIVGACNLDTTRTYYFNVVFEDPRDGYNASEPCSLNPNTFACGFRISAFQ